MQMTSYKIRQYLPNCDVLGKLRDKPGLLLRVPVDHLNVEGVQQIEQALLRAGATGWHWTHEINGQTVKIRVYFERKWTLLAFISIVVILGLIQYDIHKYFTEIIRRRISSS